MITHGTLFFSKKEGEKGVSGLDFFNQTCFQHLLFNSCRAFLKREV